MDAKTEVDAETRRAMRPPCGWQAQDCPAPARWIVKTTPCCEHVQIDFVCTNHLRRLQFMHVFGRTVFNCPTLGCDHPECVSAQIEIEPIVARSE